MPWSAIAFPEAIRKTTVGRENQILSADVKTSGRFPVIDQGQTFISGYCDAEERVIRDELPLVIFGDHTRCLKYVDFPFILGADGTKALKPKESLFDAKFFYYALLSLDIPSRGYNRHFTLLKEKNVPRPELPEQRKIADVLAVVQRAMEQQERLLALTTELKKVLLHKLFTEGLRGEPQKQTEIGPVPESWEVFGLQDLCQLIVDCPHTTPKFQTEGIRVARNFNIRKGHFVPEPASFTSEEDYRLRTKRVEPLPGDILFSREAPVGEACVIPDGMKVSLGQRTMLLRPHAVKLDAQFMVYSFYSRNVRSRMFATASGLTVPHLNVADVRSLLVPIPSLEAQQRIASAILTVDTKGECHRIKRAAFADLFRTLLYHLMTAQIRVHDLELPGLN